MSTPTKESKDRVASFRIAKTVDNSIEQSLAENPVVGCNSANKFYRKLVLDYMSGRLVYKNPSDATADPDVLDAMAALEASPGVGPSTEPAQA